MNDEIKSYVGTFILGATGGAIVLATEHFVIPGAMKVFNSVKNQINKKESAEKEVTEK